MTRKLKLLLPLLLVAAAVVSAQARPPVMDELQDRKTGVEEYVESFRGSTLVTEYVVLYRRYYRPEDPNIEIVGTDGSNVEFKDSSPSAPVHIRDGEPYHPTRHGKLVEGEGGSELIEDETRVRIRLFQNGNDFLLERWMVREMDGSEFLGALLGSHQGTRKFQKFLGGPGGERRLVHERMGDGVPELGQRAPFDPRTYATHIASAYKWDPAEHPERVTLHEGDEGYQLERRDGVLSHWIDVPEDPSLALMPRGLGNPEHSGSIQFLGEQHILDLRFPERMETRTRGTDGNLRHQQIAKDIVISFADPLEFEERLNELFED